jgi:hypothetical protein
MSRYVFADRVAELLSEHPEGLTSSQIFDRMMNEPRNSRWMPSRHTIGSKLAAIVGVEKAGYGTGYSASTTRKHVVWVLNAERFAEWRARRDA